MSKIDTEYDDLPGLRSTVIKAYADNSAMTAKHILSKNYDKPEFAIGRLAHRWLETGDRPMDGYAVSPYETYTTKVARQWRDEQKAKGIIPIKIKDYNSLVMMIDGVLGQTNDELKRIIQEAETEKVVTFDRYKAQLDICHPEANIDWKTIAQIDRHHLDCVKFHHWLQAFHYRYCECGSMEIEDLMLKPFYFGYIGKSEPHETLYREMTEEAYAVGKKQWLEAVEKMDLAEKTGEYLNEFRNEPVPFDVPDYMLEDTDLQIKESE